jgi:GntR family transcriptional regulator
LLGVPVGSPLLRCRRITTDTHGRPVLMSEHLFPAHRTEFVVDLPQDEPSSLPTGLRLVD